MTPGVVQWRLAAALCALHPPSNPQLLRLSTAQRLRISPKD